MLKVIQSFDEKHCKEEEEGGNSTFLFNREFI
jgi:hypothetical protein